MKFGIVSRYPAWGSWKRVLACPHGEREPHNNADQLEYDSHEDAERYAVRLNRWNAGDFKVIPVDKGA